jgi:predicted esterase
MNYYVVAPESEVIVGGYPMLIAVPDEQENTSVMLHHFSDITNDYGVILLIPEFTDYRFSQVKHQIATLQAMVDELASNYKLDDAGVMLFGFGDGAMIATQYANTYPEQTAHVITSGGTFLYPPSDDVPYTIIYGAEDDLLRGLTDNYAPFADLSEWKIPLNYLTIENIGHEINIQQIDITKQILLDVYQ